MRKAVERADQLVEANEGLSGLVKSTEPFIPPLVGVFLRATMAMVLGYGALGFQSMQALMPKVGQEASLLIPVGLAVVLTLAVSIPAGCVRLGVSAAYGLAMRGAEGSLLLAFALCLAAVWNGDVPYSGLLAIVLFGSGRHIMGGGSYAVMAAFWRARRRFLRERRARAKAITSNPPPR